ncbi:hypothetical protein FRB96_005464 [Tulasnella sp. 330]|nr:hypothetical protein FRB96_005464 [Tulasnella sp. 330]
MTPPSQEGGEGVKNESSGLTMRSALLNSVNLSKTAEDVTNCRDLIEEKESYPMATPIHQLPIELLMKTFRYTTGIDEPETISLHYRNLHILAQCSPLSFIMSDRKGLDIPFFLAMLKNRHRTRAAHLILQKDVELLALQKGRAPLLTTLSLSLSTYGLIVMSNCIVEDLFHGDVPKLRSLKMDRIGLRNWESRALSGLRLLHLRRLPTQALRSVDQILQVLGECPQMEDLLLHRTTAQSDSRVVQPRAVELPQLRKLNLLRIPSDAVELLLPAIKSSRCAQVKITTTSEVHLSLITSIISFSAPSFTAAALIGLGIRLSIYRTIEVSVKSKTSITPHFLLEVSCNNDLSWLPPFVEEYGGRLPVSISYKKAHPRIRPVPFAGLFLTPLVNGIELHAMRQGLDELLQELSQARTLPDGAVVWRFPELKDLRLHGRVQYDPQLLLGMVRSRTKAATCVGEGEAEVAPDAGSVLLERVEIGALDESMSQEAWEEIKSVLGEGAIWARAHKLGEVSETLGLEPEGRMPIIDMSSTTTVPNMPPSS